MYLKLQSMVFYHWIYAQGNIKHKCNAICAYVKWIQYLEVQKLSITS
jgi:hypothetical protein